MYRLLAVDYGEKNIGLALSDPLRIIAKPYLTLNNNGIDTLIHELNIIIKKENVGKIILGLPISVAGLDTQKTQEVRGVYERLSESINIPMILWDERYSTSDAKKILIEKGLSIKDSKKVIDQTAAALILTSYLKVNVNE
ncbi:MAG TPA: Holliday junction resolvase RuvX [Candidatus Cloacimonadota bacterium]|jgi:putative Holliday junction resolvase|nr:Holliday junction resolvase RuvX [Candidatus Cloacimonadales bacterium]HPY95836.1 Holliday junction resolvase RuvX [Candidatus Cloacimonadota bacterium]HQB40538.1 Holliday junction resolvase RuvX [Candidatus Cloacimonadota bacterium]